MWCDMKPKAFPLSARVNSQNFAEKNVDMWRHFDISMFRYDIPGTECTAVDAGAKLSLRSTACTITAVAVCTITTAQQQQYHRQPVFIMQSYRQSSTAVVLYVL